MNDTVQVPVGNNHFAVIDTADHAAVSRHHWHVVKEKNTTYARTRINGREVLMHQLVLGKRDGFLTDHCDRNGLNNTRLNLRFATRSENARNSVKRSDSKNTFRGVTFEARRNLWRARVTLHGKRHWLGYFKTEAEAARAYDAAARDLHGEFARLNFA